MHYWNLWWINQALVHEQVSIWYTTKLFFPYGISLYSHSLNPVNGIFGIALQSFLTLVQSYNALVILSFVLSGFSAFILNYYLTKNYTASLIAGFIFSFSSYRFAHARGHMELITTQWLPIFILYWLKFITKPNLKFAVISAIFLILNLFSTPYYFIYACITAAFLFLFNFKKNRGDYYHIKSLQAFGIFFLLLFLLGGNYIFSLKNKLAGQISLNYSPENYATDLLAPFIFGGLSRYALLTKSYWQLLPGNIVESNVYIGIVPLVIMFYIWHKRHNHKKDFPYVWYYLALFFFILSLGPVLHIWGKEIWSFLMPYTIFELLWYFLKIATPVRFMVMVFLAVSIICGYGFARLLSGSIINKIKVFCLLIVLLVEYLPQPLELSHLDTPQYVLALKKIPDNSGVIDTVVNPALRMYYQTIHEKPIQFGYLSRIPKNTLINSYPLQSALTDFDYRSLVNHYGFRYWVTPGFLPKKDYCPREIFNLDGVRIYDLTLINFTCL